MHIGFFYCSIIQGERGFQGDKGDAGTQVNNSKFALLNYFRFTLLLLKSVFSSLPSSPVLKCPTRYFIHKMSAFSNDDDRKFPCKAHDPEHFPYEQG